MGVYLEPVTSDEDGRFSRLRADALDELHDFVEVAGITAKFVAHNTVDAMGYYRCDRKDRRRALRYGAQEVSWHDAFGRLGRLIVDGTRPPVGPDFTRFGMIRRGTPTATITARAPTPPPAAHDLREAAGRTTSVGSHGDRLYASGSPRTLRRNGAEHRCPVENSDNAGERRRVADSRWDTLIDCGYSSDTSGVRTNLVGLGRVHGQALALPNRLPYPGAASA